MDALCECDGHELVARCPPASHTRHLGSISTQDGVNQNRPYYSSVRVDAYMEPPLVRPCASQDPIGHTQYPSYGATTGNAIEKTDRNHKSESSTVGLRDPSSQGQQEGQRVERRWLSHRRSNGIAKELRHPHKRDSHGEERSWTYRHHSSLLGPSQGHTNVGESPQWVHHQGNLSTEYSGVEERRFSHQPNSGARGGDVRDTFRGSRDLSSRRHGNNRSVQEGPNDPSRVQQEAPHVEDRSLLHRQGSRAQQGGRVLRNRRYRRPFDDHRHTKRLFTPEIKKFLKDWLVRRRDHPYPNRDEKKRLAVQTGLTYIQICNWFANWRRKLKNAGDEQRTTWGHLIKSYNTQAQGNVEQFSICSDDSIWEQQALNEPVDGDEDQDAATLTYATAMDHSYSVIQNKSDETVAEDTVPQEATINAPENQPQCFQVTSTTTEEEDANATPPTSGSSQYHSVEQQPQVVPTCGSSKYKSHIMEKYLRDLQLGPSQSDDANLYKRDDAAEKWTRSKEGDNVQVSSEMRTESAPNSSTPAIFEDPAGDRSTRRDKKRRTMKKTKETCPPMVLSKWLESAAKFQPTKSYVPWTVSKKDAWHPPRVRSNSKKTQRQSETVNRDATLPKMADVCWASQGHHREELDAAEALTRLSGLQH